MPGAREKSQEANAAIRSESEVRYGPGGKEGMQGNEGPSITRP